MDLLKRHCPGLRRLLTEQPEPDLFGHPNLWVPVLSAYDEADCRQPSDAPVLDGPVPSQRIEMLREGLEDREYFWLLKQAVNDLEATPAASATGERLEQCRNALAMAERALDAPNRLAQSLTVYTKDPADLYRERDALADAIEAVQAALAAAR